MKFSNLCSLQICFLRNLGLRDVQRTATLLGIYCVTSNLREWILSGLQQLVLHPYMGLSPEISMWFRQLNCMEALPVGWWTLPRTRVRVLLCFQLILGERIIKVLKQPTLWMLHRGSRFCFSKQCPQEHLIISWYDFFFPKLYLLWFFFLPSLVDGFWILGLVYWISGSYVHFPSEPATSSCSCFCPIWFCKASCCR